jgi:hypothetical protein
MRKFKVREGERIKCGDRLYWWIDASGKKFVRIAESNEEANAVAGEDLNCVDVYVDTVHGVVWERKPEPTGLTRTRLVALSEAADELDRVVRGAFATPSWEEFHEWRQEYHVAKEKFDEAYRRVLPLVNDNGAKIEFRSARPGGPAAALEALVLDEKETDLDLGGLIQATREGVEASLNAGGKGWQRGVTVIQILDAYDVLVQEVRGWRKDAIFSIRVCYECIPEEVRKSLCLGRGPGTCALCGKEGADTNHVWSADLIAVARRLYVEMQRLRLKELEEGSHGGSASEV